LHAHDTAGERQARPGTWFTNQDDRVVTDLSAAEALPSTSPESDRKRTAAVILRKWGPPLLLVVVPVFLVSLHVRAYTKLSPIDELEHIDYMFRSPGIHQVIAGTQLVVPAMREEACRGIDSVYPPPPCSTKTLVPSRFQDQGYDTAYIHPPTYYDITWGAGEVVKTVTGTKSWVTAWRLVGGFWLAAGLLMVYAAGRRMGAGTAPLLGLLLLLASAPSILQTNATVTADAASTFIGGTVLYLASRWEEGGRWRWMLLVGIGFVGTGFKLQNAIVVMMITVYFLLRARGATTASSTGNQDATSGPPAMPRPSPAGVVRQGARMSLGLLRNTRTRAVGVVLAASVSIGAAWTILQRVTETIDPNKLLVNAQFVVSSISLPEIAAPFGLFLDSIPGSYVPVATESWWTIDMANLLTWLLIAGVVGGAIFMTGNHAIASLARATLIFALLGGPIYVVLNFLSESQYFPMPPRYGFTLLPAMVVCTAYAIRARWAGICTVGAGLLSVAFVAYQLA
jgi:hypothetical protein